MHGRSTILNALTGALEGLSVPLIPTSDAVQEADVPCAVLEEREETITNFDDVLARPATALRRRYRFVIFAFGKTRLERDNLAEQIEAAIAPAVFALNTMGGEFRVKCWFAGAAFSQTRLGTSMPTFVAGQFYDAEYMSPSYM